MAAVHSGHEPPRPNRKEEEEEPQHIKVIQYPNPWFLKNGIHDHEARWCP